MQSFRFKFVVVAAALCSATAHAQSFPSRPIRYIVPQAPGGSSDTLARVITQRVGEGLGQQLVVDNRPGATGIIGAEVVARANPDGHTLLQVATSHATNPAMQAKLPYDSIRDFAPISLLSQQPNIWLVHPTTPVKNMKDLIAYAKSKPGQLNFASSGTGGSQHLAGELLKGMTGIDMTHIPYKGSPPALIDLLAGRVPLMSSTMPPALPHIKSGKVRAIAVTSAKRSPVVPEVPTVAESGVPDYEVTQWFGILAPRGTPASIVGRLNGAMQEALQRKEVRERFLASSAEPVGGPPQALGKVVAQEVALWGKLVRALDLKAD